MKTTKNENVGLRMRWISILKTVCLLFVLCLSAFSASSAGEVRVLVCLSPNAVAYHSSFCSGMNKCTFEVRWVMLSEAQRMGRKPCGFCYK